MYAKTMIRTAIGSRTLMHDVKKSAGHTTIDLIAAVRCYVPKHVQEQLTEPKNVSCCTVHGG